MEVSELQSLVNQGMSIRKIAEYTGKSPTSIRYWLGKHNLSTNDHRPRRTHKCVCGETNPDSFYGHMKGICSRCHDQYTLARGKENRSKMIAHMGGRCSQCGFDKYHSALQVHHLDPSLKDKNFGSYRTWSWKRILSEITTCTLLCANCHAAVHGGDLEL